MLQQLSFRCATARPQSHEGHRQFTGIGVGLTESRSEFDRRSSGGFLSSILGRVEDVRFNDLDLNNDGVLSSSEWRGSMSEFDRLDRNNDRVVSLSEYTY